MMPELKITSGDFFAGGGGVTVAMKNIPGMEPRWILNHDETAIRTNAFNNKDVKCYWADFYKQDAEEMEPVDFVWASVECTQHSGARGKNKPKKIGSYMLGWELLRYIRHISPYVVGIENVPEFKHWAPIRLLKDKKKSTDTYTALQVDENGHYLMRVLWHKKGKEFEKWKQAICDLGYDYSEKIFNAADHGIPTRRVRFFCFFTKKILGMQVPWAPVTHNKNGTEGLKKWVACKGYINLKKEGNSIFGRKDNENVAKGHRKPLSPNTLKRIAGGVKKFNPDMYMIMQYYGSGINAQSIESPLNTCTVKDRHVLLKIEKMQFIQDYCRGADLYNDVNEPMSPQLTWQTKHFVTVEKKTLETQFISDGTFSSEDKNTSVDEPCSALTAQQRHQKVNAFISLQNNSNGNPAANNFSIEEPCWAATVMEKFQFISSHFNSSGRPDTQNSDLESPLGSVLTGPNKKSLITAIKEGLIDFDIKMRFLDPEEIARISTFPEGYFSHPELKLSKKAATKLIGNAVPPEWAEIIITPVSNELRRILMYLKQAA